MILYHGSKNNFNIFDFSFIGLNGTSEGKGFYFTDNKSIAEGYAQNGYLYTINFFGKNPLGYTHKNITEKQYIQLVEVLDKKGDYLSNFGEVSYEGLDKVLRSAVEYDYYSCDNDAALLGSICNAYGSVSEVLEEVYNLFGYDYIEVTEADWGTQSIYVALTNDCFNINNIEEVN